VATDNFIRLSERAGRSEDRHFKTTLHQGGSLMLGLNCLEPGQIQAVHTHAAQDKFYFVVEGEGWFTVGTEARTAGPGLLVVAPAGEAHGVENRGPSRLTLLMGMAPPPAR
jgi:quercetin dioxygenase-like cupin family protein